MLFTIGAIMPPLSRSPWIIPYENYAITWLPSSLTGGDVSLFGDRLWRANKALSS
jgi:hypothetical protein